MASEGLVLVLGWPVQRMCGVGWFVAPPFPHGVGAPSPLRGGDCGGGIAFGFLGGSLRGLYGPGLLEGGLAFVPAPVAHVAEPHQTLPSHLELEAINHLSAA